ncbi:hypothetical protein SMICM304S_08277 [Streptomyces microflavus]
MDSLEKVEFAARVEWAFGVALSDEEASGIDSALAAAVLLDARLSLPAGAGIAGSAPEVARSAGGRLRRSVPRLPRSVPSVLTVPAQHSTPPSAARLRATPGSACPVPVPVSARTLLGPAPRSSPPAAIDLVDRLTGRHLAAGRGDRTAYFDPDLGAVSYRALHEAARGYAGALLAQGIAPGARARRRRGLGHRRRGPRPLVHGPSPSRSPDARRGRPHTVAGRRAARPRSCLRARTAPGRPFAGTERVPDGCAESTASAPGTPPRRSRRPRPRPALPPEALVHGRRAPRGSAPPAAPAGPRAGPACRSCDHRLAGRLRAASELRRP